MSATTMTLYDDKIFVLCPSGDVAKLPQNFMKGTHFDAFTMLVYENRPETIALLRMLGIVNTSEFSPETKQHVDDTYYEPR